MTKTTLAAAAIALGLSFGLSTAWAAGAIAVDDEENVKPSEVGYGVGWGPTRETAAAEALAECAKAGNAGCKVAVRFDSCGAYAASREHYGVGWGNSKAAAEAKAKGECGGQCQIVVSDCE